MQRVQMKALKKSWIESALELKNLKWSTSRLRAAVY